MDYPTPQIGYYRAIAHLSDDGFTPEEEALEFARLGWSGSNVGVEPHSAAGKDLE